MNSSWTDTVKCLLDAGKSPIFRSQSPCMYIYVQESQRFSDFVRNSTYCSRKGLKMRLFLVITCSCYENNLFDLELVIIISQSEIIFVFYMCLIDATRQTNCGVIFFVTNLTCCIDAPRYKANRL